MPPTPGTTPGLIPGYLPPAGTMEALRERRRLRSLWRDIFEGKWTKVLLDAQRTRHMFPETERHGAILGALIAKVNLVRPAMTLHADVVANRPVTLSVPEGNAQQREAIDAIRDECLFDATFHEAMLTVNTEMECFLAVDAGGDGAPTISIESNEMCVPVGPPNRRGGNQPSVIERRWIVERPDPADARKKISFLRVERHSAPGAPGSNSGRIEHEAYQAKRDGAASRGAITDVLVDLDTLERVPLSAAIEDPAAVPPDVIATGLPHPLITQLVSYRMRGAPAPRVSEDDIDIIDEATAAFSRLSRTFELHGDPKRRVPESLIDAKSGKVPRHTDFNDPDKEYEYVQFDAKFDSMLGFLEKVLDWLMVLLAVNPGLLGMEGKGASASDTASKLRIRSTATVAAAERSIPYVRSALERVWTLACLVDARRPTTGYPVAPVAVRVNAELPKSFADRVDEQAAAVGAGLTSRIQALREIHGEGEAEARLAEIEADESAKAERAAASLSASFGAPAAPGTPDDDETETPGGKNTNPSQPIPTGEAA